MCKNVRAAGLVRQAAQPPGLTGPRPWREEEIEVVGKELQRFRRNGLPKTGRPVGDALLKDEVRDVTLLDLGVAWRRTQNGSLHAHKTPTSTVLISRMTVPVRCPIPRIQTR